MLVHYLILGCNIFSNVVFCILQTVWDGWPRLIQYFWYLIFNIKLLFLFFGWKSPNHCIHACIPCRLRPGINPSKANCPQVTHRLPQVLSQWCWCSRNKIKQLKIRMSHQYQCSGRVDGSEMALWVIDWKTLHGAIELYVAETKYCLACAAVHELLICYVRVC